MRLCKQLQGAQTPLTLDAATQAMRQYLEDRAAHIGPDFDGWVAYQFPSIRHRLRKTRTSLAAVLAEWAKSYLRCAQSIERRARDELFDFRGRRVPKAPTE